MNGPDRAPGTESIVESVPNFSEGRRRDVIDAIVQAVRDSGPVAVLDLSSDEDHNRSVLTLAGSPPAIRRALLALTASCVERLDLRRHQGAHPRMGAVDVIPLIPVRNVTLQACLDLARDLGETIGRTHDLPVYLYEKAAAAPHRRNLAEIRKGGFEGFAAKIADPQWRPDFGPARVHPSAGCVALGVREFLIAFNINLASGDLDLARAIARTIREKDGGFPCVKAMGVMLGERGLAQVSINMTDYRTTSLFTVFEKVRAEAAARGVGVAGSEIVGLVPEDALFDVARQALKLEAFDAARGVFERRLAETAASRPGGSSA